MNPIMPLTLGSLFDGSGGFPLAGLLAGIVPVWASEIEPFPIRVTTKRLPFMKHYGDISAMDGGRIEPVDIITFGSPCTNLSIAGRREGLDGKQSSLFFQAIRIINEMRSATNGRYPRWICFENVPGIFSSNGGRDFQTVLETIISITEPAATVPPPEKGRWPEADVYVGDGWCAAYRTLDAQHWCVPQRRKRLFLVASLTDESAWKILFKSEGLSGYSAAGFRAWQAATQGLAACPGASGFDGYNSCLTGNVSSTLGVNCGMSTGRNDIVLNDQGGSSIDISEKSENITATLRAQTHGHPPCIMDSYALENHPLSSRIRIEESPLVQTLTSRMGTGGNNVPLILKYIPLPDKLRSDPDAQSESAPRAFGVCAAGSKGMLSPNPKVGFYEAQISKTLDANGGNPGCSQGGITVVEPIPFSQNQRCEVRLLGEKTGVLAAEPGMKQQTYLLTLPDKNMPNAVAWDGGNISSTITASNADGTQTMPDKGNCNSIVEPVVDHIQTASGRDIFGTINANCGQMQWQGNQEAFSGNFHILEPSYAVRRLTTTECSRLMGFPDWWCSGLDTPNPSEEEIQYWSEVFETHRRVVGKSGRPKSRNQIIKWLHAPHSDAAEYKMWGNGLVISCAFFILAGIVYYANQPQITTSERQDAA